MLINSLNFMEDWGALMHNFIPDEILTFTLEKGTTETFFEEVREPTNIRGVYFVSYDS